MNKNIMLCAVLSVCPVVSLQAMGLGKAFTGAGLGFLAAGAGAAAGGGNATPLLVAGGVGLGVGAALSGGSRTRHVHHYHQAPAQQRTVVHAPLTREELADAEVRRLAQERKQEEQRRAREEQRRIEEDRRAQEHLERQRELLAIAAAKQKRKAEYDAAAAQAVSPEQARELAQQKDGMLALADLMSDDGVLWVVTSSEESAELDLSGMSLHSLSTPYTSGMWFRTLNGIDLRSLTYLRLNGNTIETLKNEMFSHCPCLTYLSLKEMGLREIEPGAFNGTGNLEELHLEGNRLTYLPVKIIERFATQASGVRVVEGDSERRQPYRATKFTLYLDPTFDKAMRKILKKNQRASRKEMKRVHNVDDKKQGFIIHWSREYEQALREAGLIIYQPESKLCEIS